MANNERNEQREPSSPLEWPSRDVRRQSQKTGTLNRIRVVLAEQENISRWCHNKSQPSVAQLNEIANVLNVDVRTLMNSNL